MSYVLDTTTTDDYQFLVCPGASRVTLQISNAAAAVGFGENPLGKPGAGVYPPADEPYLPVIGSVFRRCDEIRIKSLAAGTPANVKIIAT